MQKLRQELIEQIQINYEQIEQVENTGINKQTFTNPEQLEKYQKQMHKVFIQKLPDISFDTPFKKLSGKKYHIIIGPISAGKTSLINYVFNTDLITGVGETTLDTDFIKIDQKDIQIIDTPGINQNFEFYDVQKLGFFKAADFLFFCFCDSLKKSLNALEMIQEIMPNKFCVIRTQVDRADQNDFKTINQELKTDREFLKTHNINAELYAVSVKKPQYFRDNYQVALKLKGKKIETSFVCQDD